MSTAKDNRLNNIHSDLTSADDKKVITALKQLRKHGTEKSIYPIVELLCSSEKTEIRESIIALLYDLKDQSVTEELVRAITDEKFASEKATLISIFWQSNLDGSEHISTFIREAIKGDYMVVVEVLTVIENFDATFQESEVEDLKFDLDDAIENETTEKATLLISIRAILDGLNLEF